MHTHNKVEKESWQKQTKRRSKRSQCSRPSWDFGAQRIDRRKTKASRQKQKKLLHSVIDFTENTRCAAISLYYFYPKKNQSSQSWSIFSLDSCASAHFSQRVCGQIVTSFSVSVHSMLMKMLLIPCCLHIRSASSFVFHQLSISIVIWDCTTWKLVNLTTKMIREARKFQASKSNITSK